MASKLGNVENRKFGICIFENVVALQKAIINEMAKRTREWYKIASLWQNNIATTKLRLYDEIVSLRKNYVPMTKLRHND